MQYLNFIIGIIVLILGVPIGNFLAQKAKEEVRQGQRWIRALAFVGLVGALASLIKGDDVWLFSFAFISVVSSRSIL